MFITTLQGLLIIILLQIALWHFTGSMSGWNIPPCIHLFLFLFHVLLLVALVGVFFICGSLSAFAVLFTTLEL